MVPETEASSSSSSSEGDPGLEDDNEPLHVVVDMSEMVPVPGPIDLGLPAYQEDRLPPGYAVSRQRCRTKKVFKTHPRFSPVCRSSKGVPSYPSHFARDSSYARSRSSLPLLADSRCEDSGYDADAAGSDGSPCTDQLYTAGVHSDVESRGLEPDGSWYDRGTFRRGGIRYGFGWEW